MNKTFCVNCNSNNLIYFQERVVTEYRKINKNGKISKKIKEIQVDTTCAPFGIICGNCNSIFHCNSNSDGEIIEIWGMWR